MFQSLSYIPIRGSLMAIVWLPDFGPSLPHPSDTWVVAAATTDAKIIPVGHEITLFVDILGYELQIKIK